MHYYGLAGVSLLILLELKVLTYWCISDSTPCSKTCAREDEKIKHQVNWKLAFLSAMLMARLPLVEASFVGF